jgi:hypothetical protein
MQDNNSVFLRIAEPLPEPSVDPFISPAISATDQGVVPRQQCPELGEYFAENIKAVRLLLDMGSREDPRQRRYRVQELSILMTNSSMYRRLFSRFSKKITLTLVASASNALSISSARAYCVFWYPDALWLSRALYEK